MRYIGSLPTGGRPLAEGAIPCWSHAAVLASPMADDPIPPLNPLLQRRFRSQEIDHGSRETAGCPAQVR